MKKYNIAIILFFIGTIELITFKIVGSKLDPDGILIEPFWLLPTGYIFILLSVISTIVNFIRKN
jgi:hypothetical protein